MIETVLAPGPGFVVTKVLALDRFQQHPRQWFAIASEWWLSGLPLLDESINDLATALILPHYAQWHHAVTGATWFAREADAAAFALICDAQVIDSRQWSTWKIEIP